MSYVYTILLLLRGLNRLTIYLVQIPFCVSNAQDEIQTKLYFCIIFLRPKE